jgi:hypothetical protein
MKAEDAADMMDQEKANDRFKQRAAVSIAILAMLLAITGLGGANAGKEATNNNIYAANHYAFYQAKNIRQTDYNLAADAIELAFLQDGSLNAEARTALKAKAEAYRKTAARYESEPETQEGKKELMGRAKDYESRIASGVPTSRTRQRTTAECLASLLRSELVGKLRPIRAGCGAPEGVAARDVVCLGP